jgi:methyl-accepting chemotaxis protein
MPCRPTPPGWKAAAQEVTQLPQTGAKVAVGLAREDVLGVEERSVDRLLVVLLGVALSAAIAAWLLAETAVLRWVAVLGNAAKCFGRGDFEHRARVRGVGELSALADAFNSMADLLSTTFRAGGGKPVEIPIPGHDEP